MIPRIYHVLHWQDLILKRFWERSLPCRLLRDRSVPLVLVLVLVFVIGLKEDSGVLYSPGFEPKTYRFREVILANSNPGIPDADNHKRRILTSL